MKKEKKKKRRSSAGVVLKLTLTGLLLSTCVSLQMPATAFDGLTPSTFTSVFTERSLANVGLVKMGRGVLATDFKAATPLFFTAQQLAQNQ